MIDMNIVKQRSEVYGNCFPLIAKMWTSYLGKLVNPQEVAQMMAMMKYARMWMLIDKGMLNSPEYDDSKKDYDNYCWITNNYEEYSKMVNE